MKMKRRYQAKGGKVIFEKKELGEGIYDKGIHEAVCKKKPKNIKNENELSLSAQRSPMV